MAAALSPGEEHDRFVEWAQKQGIEINGVGPARFAGRGMGIVAAKDLKIPKNVSIHGRLAAYLALAYNDSSSEYKPWQDIWPSQDEFKSILPINWPKELQDVLPESAKDLLNTQRTNIEKDWLQIHRSHPSIPESLFKYTWLIVNTRSFYWNYPNLPASRLPKKRQALTSEDCYAMCPFMDYFNHLSVGACMPTCDSKGYSVTANRDYKAGEEVYVLYGGHSNDLLLIEYGFILDNNDHDTTKLDHLILPRLSSSQEEILKEDGFHGNYTLSTAPPTTCHRTQAALRLLTLPSRRYDAFISGTDDGAADQAKVDILLNQLLEAYSRDIMAILEEIGEFVDNQGISDPAQKAMLLRRWKQIRDMVNVHIRELSR
ncbi:SET domain-containing protein [Zopfia rhizophila CBS 207.26]|uniref:SET domain-containing protein n=1 Tax=Zopfia rhizophila CBS 207.26 TaxID=1314779 RepID=A0A6A6E1E6_9PEZI|nr:SET domain-containing protein [Zopfia rhizophila CBS 207.26]